MHEAILYQIATQRNPPPYDKQGADLNSNQGKKSRSKTDDATSPAASPSISPTTSPPSSPIIIWSYRRKKKLHKTEDTESTTANAQTTTTTTSTTINGNIFTTNITRTYKNSKQSTIDNYFASKPKQKTSVDSSNVHNTIDETEQTTHSATNGTDTQNGTYTSTKGFNNKDIAAEDKSGDNIHNKHRKNKYTHREEKDETDENDEKEERDKTDKTNETDGKYEKDEKDEKDETDKKVEEDNTDSIEGDSEDDVVR